MHTMKIKFTNAKETKKNATKRKWWNSVDFLEEACLMFRKKEDVSETKHSV